MEKNQRTTAVVCALLAALFYALNTPFSKVLLKNIPATFMAAFLVISSGVRTPNKASSPLPSQYWLSGLRFSFVESK